MHKAAAERLRSTRKSAARITAYAGFVLFGIRIYLLFVPDVTVLAYAGLQPWHPN